VGFCGARQGIILKHKMLTRKQKCRKGRHVLITNINKAKLECVFCGKLINKKVKKK